MLDSTVWEVMELLGGRTFLKEVHCWGAGFESYSSSPLPVCFPCFNTKAENVISQLPAPATCCSAFSTTMDLPSGIIIENKVYLLQIPLGHAILSQQNLQWICVFEARDAVFNRYPLHFLRLVLSLNLNSTVQLSWLPCVLQGGIRLSLPTQFRDCSHCWCLTCNSICCRSALSSPCVCSEHFTN